MRSFAYGHTRIPEFAFGGATQFILKVHERFDVHGALRVPHTVWNTLELYFESPYGATRPVRTAQGPEQVLQPAQSICNAEPRLRAGSPDYGARLPAARQSMNGIKVVSFYRSGRRACRNGHISSHATSGSLTGQTSFPQPMLSIFFSSGALSSSSTSLCCCAEPMTRMTAPSAAARREPTSTPIFAIAESDPCGNA